METPSKISSGNLPIALLGSRLLLFGIFQAILAGMLNSWQESEKYWLLTATLTNLVSITLLFFLFKREGQNYFALFRLDRSNLKKDLLLFLGLAALLGPIVFVPGYFLSQMIWGDANVPTEMMFAPIERGLVYFLLVAFPITIGLAELATYFGYIMPRLKTRFNHKYLAAALPILFLSIQHCTLPFIPDIHFILYRALVFLPLAILIGVSIFYRPTLFLYFAVLHAVMDFGTAYMFFLELS